MAGGFGVNRIDCIARSILDQFPTLHIIAVAARNTALHDAPQIVARESPAA